MSPALLPLDCRGRLGGWPPLCRAAMGLSRTPRTCRGQTGPRHGFHQCGIKPTRSDTVSPDISTHDLDILGTSFCLCAALLLVELMLTTASRLHSAPAERMLWPCLGGEASRALGVEKPADKEPSGQGAKRTQILAMGCSTPGLALWRGCLACRFNGRILLAGTGSV